MHQPYQIHLSHRGLPFWCSELLRSPRSGLLSIGNGVPKGPLLYLAHSQHHTYSFLNICFKVISPLDVCPIMTAHVYGS